MVGGQGGRANTQTGMWEDGLICPPAFFGDDSMSPSLR